MKKILLLNLCLSLASCTLPLAEESAKATKKPVYLLGLKLPACLQEQSLKTEDLSCIYHGVRIPFINGYCQLPERSLKTFFALVITPSVEMKAHGTCQYMERVKELPCKWYNLNLHLKEVAGTTHYEYFWDIQELKPEEMPLRIPDHAGIVLQLPADYIEALEQDETPRKGYFVLHLPEILLSKELAEGEFASKVEEIAQESIDLAIHCPRTVSEQKKLGTTTIIHHTQQ